MRKNAEVKKHREPIIQFEISPESKGGISAKYMHAEISSQEHDIFVPHRDKHYLIAISTAGSFKILIDFQEIVISPAQILFISPGQVHQVLELDNPQAIGINFDPSLISEELKIALQHVFKANLLTKLNPDTHQNIVKLGEILISTLESKYQKFTGHSANALLQAVLNMLADTKTGEANNDKKDSRPAIIYEAFQKLLGENYLYWKRPADYAAAISISVSHLNDVVKDISGESVSQQIRQRNVLEAKRLLFFSSLTVKEISFGLGYDDPIYFSKLFKKATKVTPLAFRQQYRK